MRRIPWSLLLGVGVGLLLLRNARRRKGGRGTRGRLPREPEVVRLRGPTPVEGGLEEPLATGYPDPVPGRTMRGGSPAHQRPPPAGFQPVVPDAPEERDPAAEPGPVDPDGPAGEPVPPVVRRHGH
ncbi:MAG TPA: hypothetical protein VGF31_13135 [Myxococcaceae bacterium]